MTYLVRVRGIYTHRLKHNYLARRRTGGREILWVSCRIHKKQSPDASTRPDSPPSELKVRLGVICKVGITA